MYLKKTGKKSYSAILSGTYRGFSSIKNNLHLCEEFYSVTYLEHAGGEFHLMKYLEHAGGEFHLMKYLEHIGEEFFSVSILRKKQVKSLIQ